jgi:hypothetical protein
MTTVITKIKEAPQVSPAPDAAAFPVDNAAADGYIEVGDVRLPITNTLDATNASYTPANYEILTLDDVGDDTNIAVTMAAALIIGTDLTIFAQDGGATGHTVKLTAQTYDGTNNTATFNAAGDFLVIRSISSTRVIIIVNNSVTLSIT